MLTGPLNDLPAFLGFALQGDWLAVPSADDLFRMLLRFGHFVAGITWVGLLYFFNLVNVPLMKELDGPTKGKVIPKLMPKALYFFRWSAVVTVLVGMLYFALYILPSDAQAAGKSSVGWFHIWLVIAIAVAAILLGFVFNGYFRAEAGANARGLIQQGQSITAGLRQAYPAGGNPAGRYSGLTNTNFIASQQAPKEMVNGAAGLLHQDLGSVDCTATSLNGVANAGASCVWTAVKGTSCAPFVGSMRDAMEAITVGATVVKNSATPYNQAAVNTACNAATINVTLLQG